MFLRRSLFLNAQPTPGSPAAPSPQRTDEFVNRLVLQHGTAEAAIRYLASQQITTSDALERAQQERDALKTRLPEGAVVLTGDQAKAWGEIVAAKLEQPGAVTGAVRDRDHLKGEIASRDRERDIRAMAPAAGFPNADAAVDLLTAKPLAFEWRETDVAEKGQTERKRLPYVKRTDDEKAAPELLSAYAQRELSAHLPSLTTVRGQPAPTTPTPGVPHIVPRPTARSADTSAEPVAAHLLATINNLPPGLLPART